MKTYKSLASTIKEVVQEAHTKLHPNQQKLDVHEPEKDKLTADDFKKLRAGKKEEGKDPIQINPKLKEEVEQIDEDKYDRMLNSMLKGKSGERLLKKHSAEVKKSRDIESGKALEKHIKKNPGVLKTYAKAVKRDKEIYGEDVEQIDEKSDQAKQNKTMKNVMTASKGAQINRSLKLDPAEYGYKKAQHLNKAIGRAAMRDEAIDEASVALTAQHVKQGIGIARDKRYAGGNMTGAVKAMKKIHPDLSKHPAVEKELQKQNEDISLITGSLKKNYGLSDDLINTVRKAVAESMLRDPGDLAAKRKALKDLSTNKDVDQKVVQQRKLDLEKEAKSRGMAEGKIDDLMDKRRAAMRDKPEVKSSGGPTKLADLPKRTITGKSYGADYVDPAGADDADMKKPKRKSGSQGPMRRRFNTKSYARVGGKLPTQAK